MAPPPIRITRRSALALMVAAGAGTLVACGTSPTPTPGPSTSTADPDEAVRAAVAADEAGLIALYDAALSANPSMAGQLQPLRDQHVQHARSLVPSGSASTNPSGAPASGSALAAPTVSDLMAAEQTAAESRTRACASAADVELARLLALIAASEAGHAQALRGAGA